MPIRILHLADLHLGAKCAHWPGHADDLLKTFERAVDRALDAANPAHAVIIAGDLFDRHRPPAAVLDFAKGQLERLLRGGVEVVMVPGTHDSIEYPDSVLREELVDGVTLLTDPNVGEPRTLTLAGEPVHFYGMAYQRRRSRPPFDSFRRQDAPGYHIAVIHGSLEGSPAWETPDRYVPLNLQRLGETGMHYVALGHYHQFRRCEANGVLVAYPGVIEGLHFSDAGHRYLTWVELADDRAALRRQEPGDAPVNTKLVDVRVVDFGVQPMSSQEELVAHIQKWADSNLILQVRLRGPAEFLVDAHALSERLRPLFAHIEIVDDEVSFQDSLRLEELARQPTVLGLFVRTLRERIQTASDEEERRKAELALRLGIAEFLKE